MFFKLGVLKISQISRENICVFRCFSVKFAEVLITPFFMEHIRWRPLYAFKSLGKDIVTPGIPKVQSYIFMNFMFITSQGRLMLEELTP